jgi:hypothetical protein
VHYIDDIVLRLMSVAAPISMVPATRPQRGLRASLTWSREPVSSPHYHRQPAGIVGAFGLATRACFGHSCRGTPWACSTRAASVVGNF